MYSTKSKMIAVVAAYGATLAFSVMSPTAQQGGTITTIAVPPELPVEIETELAPGSLKQVPLWHELAQILEDPSVVTCPPDDPVTFDDESRFCIANIERRQSFGVTMPPLNVWSPCFNVLTGEPLRRRVSDAGISWDKPGLLFRQEDDGNPATPLTVVIGRLVVDAGNQLVVADRAPGVTDLELPPDGTVVAVPACNSAGQPVDPLGNVVVEFETPISELDFFWPADPNDPMAGRPTAQALGKALFWDMQVGSDSVQACASCHFHAGVDNRTKNQLNPNHLGGDLTLQVHAAANQDLVAADYPFHRLTDIDGPGDPLTGNVASDKNDVMSSMGVRFRKFGDIPVTGGGTNSDAFIRHTANGALIPPSSTTVLSLAADCPLRDGINPVPLHCLSGLPQPFDPQAQIDPIPLFQGFRRVEPRNTPTIFGTAFNFDNFWDGRARHDANGGSVFGPTDPQFHIFVNDGTFNDVPRGATNGFFRPDLLVENPEVAGQPVRIRFSSLASLATGPALSEFEMSFAGRNWPKLGKKLLQSGVTPLANQLVSPDDSVLGPFSGQRSTVNGPVDRPGRPGLNVTYAHLIEDSFRRELWGNVNHHFHGRSAPCLSAVNGALTPAPATPPGHFFAGPATIVCDPFDGYVLDDPAAGGANSEREANPADTNEFTQMEANFSLFFGLSVQAWQQVLIPDDTAFDRFLDANPNAANGVGQPGEQGTLPPAAVPGLVGPLTFPDPDLFGPDELFGFDIFTGANLTAALPIGSSRNPAGFGSNPFLRTGRCMMCHFGPEQTDHTNNVNAGLLLSDTEFEFPTPPTAPEPTGGFRVVTGLPLAEEVEENAQDGVELELRNFATMDDPNTPIDERVIGFPGAFSFQDNGVYNIGVRPTNEDIMRGGTDAFGWPLAIASLSLKNLAGPDFEPCDTPLENPALGDCTGAIATFDPSVAGFGLFDPTGADQRINPGLAMEPAVPQLPPYLAPWVNNLPAGELHPQIDELAVLPNTITEPNAGPTIEFAELLFGSDTNCGLYDPAQFGDGPPTFGWGTITPGVGGCPNSQTGVPNNSDPPLNGTWPFVNRIARNGAVKAPQLRNVELTGPYFHTGSYLTLRQVVDFYMRGGDFPVTNGEDRDPNLVDIEMQAFGFGATNNAANLPPELQDGFPDTISQYGPMPDTSHAVTPEYAAAEDAKVSLVKFLLSLTDQRVKFERAPFDHPEIFVPLDGAAPDNGSLPVTGPQPLGGREAFLSNLTNGLFSQVPAVGAAGRATPLQGFLGVTTNPAANCSTEISHFCR